MIARMFDPDPGTVEADVGALQQATDCWLVARGLCTSHVHDTLPCRSGLGQGNAPTGSRWRRSASPLGRGDTPCPTSSSRTRSSTRRTRSRGGTSASGTTGSPARWSRSGARPVGSTRAVDVDTSKQVVATRPDRCHVSHVVAGSHWETRVAGTIEALPRVRCFVKNQGLGFTIP